MAVVEAGATTYKENVFQLTISKLEPECVNYAWQIQQTMQAGRPEVIEQLVMAKNIIEQALQECEEKAIHEYIKVSRDARRQLLEERLKKESEPPAPDAVH